MASLHFAGFCRHLAQSVPVPSSGPCAVCLSTHKDPHSCPQAPTTPPSKDLPGLGVKGHAEANRKGVSARILKSEIAHHKLSLF